MTGLTLALGLLLQAAPASITIPITPPVLTVPVNQPVTIGGVTYQATGTLTLTPAVTTAVAPAITGYQTLAGLPWSKGLADKEIVVLGHDMGSAGLAWLDGLDAEVVSWEASRIVLKLDRSPTSVGIRTAEGTYYIGSIW